MVSAVIPAYNIADQLERCVNSILRQTYRDFEILIVDDGSTDGTSALCDQLCREHSCVKVFHKENGGVSTARNLGIEHLRGDFTVFIDGDDWIEPTLFEDAVASLDENDADIFMYEYIVDTDGVPTVHSVDGDPYGLIDTEQALIHTLKPDNRLLWSKLFRTKLIANSRFREGITMGEDTLFITEIILRSKRTVYSARPYYHYVIRGNSAVTSSFRMKKLTGLEAYRAQMDLCKAAGFTAAEEYARAALMDLAVALARRAAAADRETRKQAFCTIKKCVRSEKKRTLRSKRIGRKTKLKTLVASISPAVAVAMCNMLGEKA